MAPTVSNGRHGKVVGERAEAYRRCWARAVSPCGEGMSGEHYVTRGTFLSEWVTVKGPQFLGGGERRRVDSLVARVLCARHNSDLSPLDQALIDLVNALREMERLRRVRSVQRVAPRYAPVRLVVDGPRIERCILKMAMSCAKVLRRDLSGWTPPEWLPEVVFGKRKLDTGCGLAIVARLGDVIAQEEQVSFHFGQSQSSGEPEAVILGLRKGLQILCTWRRPVADTGVLQRGDSIYVAHQDAILHPRRLEYKDGVRDLGLSLDFDWTGKWREKDNKAVAKLRSKYRAPPRRGKKRRAPSAKDR